MAPILNYRTGGMGENPTLPYNTALIVIVFLALAASHAVEVLINTFRRFQRYNGVYFYSLLCASTGIGLHALGYFLRNYGISNSAALEISLACGGGMLMITGMSLVLWSRLHLISPGKRDRWMLWMIIAACIIVQGGATTLFARSNSANPELWLKIYPKWEIFQSRKFKRVFTHLIVVNVIVMLLDATVLALQCAGKYRIQTSWKTLAYAIKLRLEFEILIRLVDSTKAGFSSGRSGSRHVSGITGGQGGAGTEGTPRNQFGTSTYERLGEDSLTALPLQTIVKTTEIQVSVVEDAGGEGNTK